MPQPSTTSPRVHPHEKSEGHGHHNPHAVVVHVNERPVTLPERTAAGAQIKRAAIDQGVPIHLEFILVQELGQGRTQVIGDRDTVHVNEHSRFLANDGDDNS